MFFVDIAAPSFLQHLHTASNPLLFSSCLGLIADEKKAGGFNSLLAQHSFVPIMRDVLFDGDATKCDITVTGSFFNGIVRSRETATKASSKISRLSLMTRQRRIAESILRD